MRIFKKDNSLKVLDCKVYIIYYKAYNDVVARVEVLMSDGTIEQVYIIERDNEMSFKYENKYIMQFKETIIDMYEEIKDIHIQEIEEDKDE